MDTKFVGKSKTIIGIVLATVVLWAPTLGFDFSEEDSNVIMSNLDQILVQLGLVYAAVGRIVATTKLTLK